MNNWVYKGKEIKSFKDLGLETAEGFVYKIETECGKKYIGKKNFFSRRKKHFGKKKLAAIKDKRLKTYEYIVKESDWLKYYGSNSKIKELVKKGVNIKKEILHIAMCKSHLTFLEAKYLFEHNVLNDDNYLNDNILGKFYTKTIICKK
jgi:hypothetical protein